MSDGHWQLEGVQQSFISAIWCPPIYHEVGGLRTSSIGLWSAQASWFWMSLAALEWMSGLSSLGAPLSSAHPQTNFD